MHLFSTYFYEVYGLLHIVVCMTHHQLPSSLSISFFRIFATRLLPSLYPSLIRFSVIESVRLKGTKSFHLTSTSFNLEPLLCSMFVF